MKLATRRALIAGGGVVAAGTLAAVAVLRKPEAPVIHTLVPGVAPGVHPIRCEGLASENRCPLGMPQGLRGVCPGARFFGEAPERGLG